MISQCLKCKGRLFCGRESCRILDKYSRQKKVASQLKGKSFSGSSPPSVFVSWKNYPKVNLAPVSPPFISQEADLYDNPEKWFGLAAERIISYRESLIMGQKRIDVHSAANPGKQLTEIQEMVMASRPVAIEVELKKIPDLKLSFSDTLAPMGPSALLDKFSLTENPRIPKKIDYLVSDTEVKALTGIMELYDARTPVHSLTKLLSAGLLGVQKNRRLVPTRYSITAIDSNVSQKLINEIKYFPEINEIQLFRNDFVGNYFFILLIPGCWSFENLECWYSGSLWQPGEADLHIIQDHEFFEGRTTYADNVMGAYYAARLGVCEHLKKIKRQASVLVFREILPEYNCPLGVFVIRETVRHAFESKPLSFQSLDLALKYIDSKLKAPLKKWVQASQLLDRIKHQKKIVEWL